MFATTEDLPIVPSSLAELGSMIDGKTYRDHWAALEKGTGLYCFKEVPAPGDALYIGLSEAGARPTPSGSGSTATSRASASTRTTRRSTWEAWSGEDWESCELDSDYDGRAQPRRRRRDPRPALAHRIADREAAGRLDPGPGDRARSRASRPTAPRRASPASARSPIGGTADAVNAELVRDEEIGIAEGVPGQRFALKRQPVVPSDEAAVLEVSGDDGWDEWQEVADFAGSGPDDKHFVPRPECRRGPARPGGPPGGRDPATLRRRAGEERPAPPPLVPHRRRPQGQRRAVAP